MSNKQTTTTTINLNTTPTSGHHQGDVVDCAGDKGGSIVEKTNINSVIQDHNRPATTSITSIKNHNTTPAPATTMTANGNDNTNNININNNNSSTRLIRSAHLDQQHQFKAINFDFSKATMPRLSLNSGSSPNSRFNLAPSADLNKHRWSRDISAKRNKLLNQLSQIEIGRKRLELKGHTSFLDIESPNKQTKANVGDELAISKLASNDNRELGINNNNNNDDDKAGHDQDALDQAPENRSGDDSKRAPADPASINSACDDICVDPIQPANLQDEKESIGPTNDERARSQQISWQLDQLELFVSTQVPPNKRILCLIVRDNNNNTNQSNATTRQDNSQSQSRVSKSKSAINPTCYLFVQAIVDIEPINSLQTCQHSACHDQRTQSQQSQGQAQLPLKATGGQADGQLIMSNQSGDDEDDSISISSSLSADLLFVENARAATSNKKKQQQQSLITSSSSANPVSSGRKPLKNGADINGANGDENHNGSVADSFSDDDSNLRPASKAGVAQDESRNNSNENLADSPLVYPNEMGSQQASPTLPLPNSSSSPLDSGNNNNTRKRPSDLVQSASPADLISQLFDNDLNQYTGAVGVVLSGKRRKNAKTYLIGLRDDGHSSNNSICKLRSNVLGTQFNAIRRNQPDRCPIASIIYETNVLGMKGPRKMRIFMAKDQDSLLTRNKSVNLVEAFKKVPSSIIQLRNTTPVWNMETQSYVLNFHGRVTQPSVKNFQLIQFHEKDPNFKDKNIDMDYDLQQQETKLQRSSINGNDQHRKNKQMIGLNYDTSVVMQFGRTSSNEFTCDVTYPLSILQAFSIALSSLDSKLACE